MIWKDVKGYEGLYQVSDTGLVKRIPSVKCKTERILQQGTQKTGYKYVNLSKNSRPHTKRVHRLVAETFIPNPDNLPQINHKDENKANNNVNNLEWCSEKYNVNYGTRRKRCSITRGTTVQCVETGQTYPSARNASQHTGIYQSSISRCCNKDYGFKTAGGYHWKYVTDERVYRCKKIK